MSLINDQAATAARVNVTYARQIAKFVACAALEYDKVVSKISSFLLFFFFFHTSREEKRCRLVNGCTDSVSRCTAITNLSHSTS